MFELQTSAMAIGMIVLKVLIILIVGKIAIGALSKVAKAALDRSKVDAMSHGFILRVLRMAIWIVVIIALLNVVGINTSSLVTMIAAAGAAIALGLQGSLSNLASGIIIMFTKPFKKGDFVSCAGSAGIVDGIDLLSTTIITVDNKVITVPNGQLTSNSITNFSKESTRRVDVSIGIAYDTDIEHAMSVMMELADADRRVLKDPAAVVLVEKYDASSIVLTIRMWTLNANYWDVLFSYQQQLKPSFDKAGITIPFPQMDVTLKK